MGEGEGECERTRLKTWKIENGRGRVREKKNYKRNVWERERETEGE
jgi:hypothetical protein